MLASVHIRTIPKAIFGTQIGGLSELSVAKLTGGLFGRAFKIILFRRAKVWPKFLRRAPVPIIHFKNAWVVCVCVYVCVCVCVRWHANQQWVA